MLTAQLLSGCEVQEPSSLAAAYEVACHLAERMNFYQAISVGSAEVIWMAGRFWVNRPNGGEGTTGRHLPVELAEFVILPESEAWAQALREANQ